MRVRHVSSDAKRAGLAAFLSSTTFAAALGITAPAEAPGPGHETGVPAPSSVELQLLGVNDFHGRLEPPKAVSRRPGGPPVEIGGAAALDAHLDRAERSHPGRTIRVHAGDMVGASPLLSSHFHDEPTIRAMNLMDFDVGTLGNHEFDEGGRELTRLLRGGPRTDGHQFKRDAGGRDVDTSAPDFEGAAFPYIAANTVDRANGLALPPTLVIEREGVKVGFIGVTTTATPHHVLDRHSGRFKWLDISDTVNRHAPRLQRQGVEAIVVLAHSGAYHAHGDSEAAAGEIVDETREMTGAVDVVIAGHTHSHLNTRVPNRDSPGEKLVVEANSYGAAYDRVRMTVDRRSGEVTAMHADTPTTWNDEVTPDPAVGGLVDRYRSRLGGLGDRLVGHLEDDLVRGTSLGDAAAEAQLRLAKADVAFVEGGNSRGSLSRGPVTYAELFEASSYEHEVLRMEMTGAGIRRILDQQWEAEPNAPLHVAGLDEAAPDEDATYVVAANALLVNHDRFPAFRDHGRHIRAVGTDLEALEAWMRPSRRENAPTG